MKEVLLVLAVLAAVWLNFETAIPAYEKVNTVELDSIMNVMHQQNIQLKKELDTLNAIIERLEPTVND